MWVSQERSSESHRLQLDVWGIGGGLRCQSKASTHMWIQEVSWGRGGKSGGVQGAAPAIEGQHPCRVMIIVP